MSTYVHTYRQILPVASAYSATITFLLAVTAPARGTQTIYESQILRRPDGSRLRALDMEDHRLLVGGYGAAFVYELDAGGNWTEAAEFTPDSADTRFGESVALDGDTAIVASDARSQFYERAADGSWSLVFEATATSRFIDVSLDRSTAVLVTQNAMARTFRRDVTGGWVEEPPTRVGGPIPWIADADLDDGTLIVGDLLEGLVTGFGSNRAYFYEPGTTTSWTQVADFGPFEGAPIDSYFPDSVAIDGDIALGVGLLDDKAHVWLRDADGNWSAAGVVETPLFFVGDVALDGTTALLTEGENASGESNSPIGSFLVERSDDGSWSYDANLIPSDIGFVSGYGRDSALTSDWAAISGGRAVYLFDLSVLPKADFDGDGDVDGNDFLIWQNSYLAGGLASGDADNDGDADGDDFLIWQSEFQPASGTASATPVPEPNAAIALILAMFGLGRPRGYLGRSIGSPSV